MAVPRATRGEETYRGGQIPRARGLSHGHGQSRGQMQEPPPLAAVTSVAPPVRTGSRAAASKLVPIPRRHQKDQPGPAEYCRPCRPPQIPLSQSRPRPSGPRRAAQCRLAAAARTAALPPARALPRTPGQPPPRTAGSATTRPPSSHRLRISRPWSRGRASASSRCAARSGCRCPSPRFWSRWGVAHRQGFAHRRRPRPS
jgi:hypothetical protein